MYHRVRRFALALAVGASAVCAGQINPHGNTLASQNQLLSQPSLSGMVAAMDGAPLHDIRIEVRVVNTGNLVQTCFSGPNGSFEAFHLRPGAYEVVAVDGASETREHVIIESGTASVTLRMPPTFRLSPKRHRVHCGAENARQSAQSYGQGAGGFG
jgi:hypothetical protein